MVFKNTNTGRACGYWDEPEGPGPEVWRGRLGARSSYQMTLDQLDRLWKRRVSSMFTVRDPRQKDGTSCWVP